jgi:hypothetical protein
LLTGLLDLPGAVAVEPASWQVKSGRDEVIVPVLLTRWRLRCSQRVIRAPSRQEVDCVGG